MQRLTILLCFSALLTAPALTAADAPFVPQVPRKAEAFGIQTGQDKYVFLNQYPGKTIILAFVLTDCDHCQFTAGILNRIQQDYVDRGVVVLASAIEIMSALHIPDFVAKYHPNFLLGYDPQDYATTFLGYPDNYPMSLPQILFIDSAGTIQMQFAGDDKRIYRDIEEKTLRDTLDGLLKKKMGQTATRPSAPK